MSNIREFNVAIPHYQGGDTIENRRAFSRFDTQFSAQYFLKERKGDWRACTVSNISRKGMGIQFHSPNTISTGSAIHLEITTPTALKSISVEGIVQWSDKVNGDLMCGIEWFRLDGSTG